MGTLKDTFKKDIFGIKAKKVNSEPNDGYKNGTKCTIIAESPDTPYGLIYLAIFEDFPLPVAVTDFRVKFLANEKKTKIKLNVQQRDYLEQFPEKLFNYYTENDTEKEQEKPQNHKKN